MRRPDVHSLHHNDYGYNFSMEQPLNHNEINSHYTAVMYYTRVSTAGNVNIQEANILATQTKTFSCDAYFNFKKYVQKLQYIFLVQIIVIGL